MFRLMIQSSLKISFKYCTASFIGICKIWHTKWCISSFSKKTETISGNNTSSDIRYDTKIIKKTE